MEENGYLNNYWAKEKQKTGSYKIQYTK